VSEQRKAAAIVSRLLNNARGSAYGRPLEQMIKHDVSRKKDYE